ncbi:Mitochondrial substrate carrier family protein [Perilla frutescens var. hirtella]|uniref:Mitochondrial substrate carrier family protein n=1 Tax=Perilla frutescens var. hirtella TaxID=608512 RepID=A0AAD4J481_PERFH|nr:Mitochondrial substrate carrier family protein [Perilla frutescens var. hirtella]
MSLVAAEDNSAAKIHVPAEINWEMLDKSKFFFLGAALFSGVSFSLYPIIVLKTRQQIFPTRIPCLKMAESILRRDGYRGFYRGFTTSLVGTIPARALYMGALELTRTNVADIASRRLRFSEAKASAAANAAAGVSAAAAAQLVWNPIDVVSQRLMVQDSLSLSSRRRYSGGVDAFAKIVCENGVRGLYRGFGVSILTHAPSNGAWWASYSVVYRAIWDGIGGGGGRGGEVAVQGMSAAVASGVSALVTMPLDTIKTRTQVMEGGESESGGMIRVARDMVKEGGFGACYRGFGPRWASMSVSATAMITTYEFLKRLSTKNQEIFA